MPKTIRYIGTQNHWPERAYTGSAETWMPLEADECSDAHAAALMGTGLFADVAPAPYVDSSRALPPVAGGGAPARITGGNRVGDVLTVERAEGWQFTTGQWYLDGVATGSATAGLTLTQLSAAVGKAYGFQPTGIPFRAIAAVTVAAGAAAPVFTSQPSITGTSQAGQVLTAVDGAASNATSITRQWYLDGAPVSTAQTLSLAAGDVGKVPSLRNFASGPGGGPVQSNPATAAAVIAAAGQPVITFQTSAVQGQWVRENIVQNTRDRSTTGDYYMIATAGNGGAFRVIKRLPDGTYSAAVQLASNEPDDHNVPALLQLPSGKWLAFWNRHTIAGVTGFRYAVTATAHGMDFGTARVITGSATWNGGTANSTYVQAYMIGDRVIVFYRVGGSQNGAWVCRYSDDIGAATPTWSVERFVTPTAYMDSSLNADGVTLHCAMYDHPYNTLSHDMFTFDVNMATGAMVAAGSGTVIGNVFTNTTPVANSATRQAVAIASGTSRLFNMDALGNLYGMEMEGGHGTTVWPSGTYYRYVRTASGVYTKQAVCETGLPFLGSQQGYYGSICRLDANRVLVSVNIGASVGVGSWELREYVTSDGGASWSLAATHTQSTAIIMRPQAINTLMFWYEATSYASFDSFASTGKFMPSLTASNTPRPSLPAGTDPVPAGPVAPTITGAPANASVTEGADVTFSITVTGTYDAVQWQTQASGSSTWVDNADADNNTSLTLSAVALSANDSKVRARAGNGGVFSSWSAEATLTVTAAGAGDGFTAVPASTMTFLTDLGGNQYQATNAAASQGGILYTALRSPAAGTPFAVRGSFDHAGAAFVIGFGTATSPTDAAVTQQRRAQITAAGLVQYTADSGTVSTPFTFATRSPNNIIELSRDASHVYQLRVSENNGTSWTDLGPVGLAYTSQVYLRCYCSYSTGVTPNNRVIDKVRHQGLVAV